MKKQTPIFIGKNEACFGANEVLGKQVQIDKENYYKIANVNEMRPFFMSIVSHSNHWLFLSSNGGLSAGRKNSNNALFPYYTDDKITELSEVTGSKTILKVQLKGNIYLWEPFSDKYKGVYDICRNLYKNSYGNKVIFEEHNKDLGICFQYHWNTSERYGFVKRSVLKNENEEIVDIEILDGIQNIIPYGVGEAIQTSTSNLVDAYKKSELEADTALGIYALSAIIVDKAEPSEALKATTVWSLGIEKAIYLLSSLQLEAFRQGQKIHQELDIKAEKGAYFICAELRFNGKEQKDWLLIADVNQSVAAINETKRQIKNDTELKLKVQADIDLGTQKLVALSGNADGIQLTADEMTNTRHFSNTLFNIMRGGIFDDNYQIEKQDFLIYLKNANIKTYKAKSGSLQLFPDKFSVQKLRTLANEDKDNDFRRLCLEYMPLKFSRRHGDPSRPWNKFSINMKSEVDGSKILDYEGNWRDIFQNWEALAHSYPDFIDSMIHKFLNASTFDGYNPYRVTKGGFDWEIIEPDDPWSYIGYWGDHQIIYLLKFLEFSENYYPKHLATYFSEDLFVYANVPYKIKSYAQILENPKDTIVFDKKLHDKIEKERTILGADAALLGTKENSVYKVNLVEKLLATVLAKLSNFIPEAGIWMNTQRPEWNDANNALVGNGVSMVTLYYLRRFLKFFEQLLQDKTDEGVVISEELLVFFEQMAKAFEESKSILVGSFSDRERRKLMDKLGEAGSQYRLTIYNNGFSTNKKQLNYNQLSGFIKDSLAYLEHSIRANKRADKLYHAYNLITIGNEQEVTISYLPEMLEGQVAALSSGYIDSKASLELLDALKKSALFRADQYSYILYPNKELPRFMAKNNIPKSKIATSELVKHLLEDENKHIIEKDVLGQYHFNGAFNNAESLRNALSKLPQKYQKWVEKDQQLLLAIFEEIFNHKAFTGRSGTFFGYEGLGSIYWHMVSKLLLSVQEICIRSINTGQDEVTVGRLLEHYYEINEGVGVHKSPKLYGAFPTDPYSHTPGSKGAQQPGMTGQVKEDILTRFGELGVFVKNGKLHFAPCLLRKQEFLEEAKSFTYQTVDKEERILQMGKDSLCFTTCQVPVVYKIAEEEKITVRYDDGSTQTFADSGLEKTISLKVFQRTGELSQITVFLRKENLR